MTQGNITITKYPIVKYGENFPETVETLPEPIGSEVVVKIRHCGVCHSDLHLKEGHFDLGNDRKFAARALHRLPHTLGHEIEGEVISLGPEAEDIKPGDRRIVFAWIGCGKCKPCLQGNEHLCTRPRHLGITQDGGYATHVVVPHSRYLLDYTGILAEQAGSFMCAGLTAYGALNRFDRSLAQATRLIIGFGGVGMMGLQLAKLMFKEPVLIADTDAEKRKLALEMGALDVFDPTDSKQRNEIIKKHGAVDAILDLVGTEKTADIALGMINKGGKLVLAGLFGGELAYPIPYFAMKGIAVEGSYVGSLQDAKDMLEMVRQGDYQPIQTSCRPLCEVNEALDDLACGRIDGRVVLECGSMIEQTFNEIKEILSKKFPELVASLNPPATEQEIQFAETAIGRRFPEDLKKLYLMHNGQKGYSGLFFGLCFIDLENVIREWQTWHDVGKDDLDSLDTDIISIPYRWIKEQYVNDDCIAISKDGGGNNIVVDLSPDENGVSGQVTNYGRDENTRYVIAPSISLFFDFILTQIKADNFTIINYDDHKIFSLKEPADTHFLDTLKHFDLPHGVEIPSKVTDVQQEMSFEDWYNQQDTSWQDLIKKRIDISKGFLAIQNCHQLNLMGSEISDLTPISKFVSLRKLILSGLPISDLAPLQNLSYLKSLFVGKTQITDLAPLSSLHDLVYLSLNNTQIDNITNLLSLHKLKELNLEGTCIRDLDAVSQMQNLHFLSLQWNSFVRDLSPLSKIKSLKRLNIADTKVEDLSFIQELQNLQELTVYNTDVDNYEPLKSIQSLKFVTCSIEDFYKIRDILPYKIRFSIAGKMSDEQRKDWESY